MALYQKFLDSIKGLKSSLSKDPTTQCFRCNSCRIPDIRFIDTCSIIAKACQCSCFNCCSDFSCNFILYKHASCRKDKIRAIRFLGKNDILCCSGSWNFSCSNLLGVKVCLIKLLVLDHSLWHWQQSFLHQPCSMQSMDSRTQLAPNMVTLVVFDWRAFDTLGESLILVTAVLVVLLVFGKGKILDKNINADMNEGDDE